MGHINPANHKANIQSRLKWIWYKVYSLTSYNTGHIQARIRAGEGSDLYHVRESERERGGPAACRFARTNRQMTP